MTPQGMKMFAVSHCKVTRYTFQLKLCESPNCFWCPRIGGDKRAKGLDWFPVNTISDGKGGWMSLNEIYELLQSATSRAQRQALLDVFVFDDSLPENMVKTARVNNSDLTTSFAATRIKILSDHSNLGGDNIKAMFKKLDQAKKLVLENQKHKWQV